ncbi:MAG: ATP-binding cassette domain-containing protein [Planctomycetota bacterium]
MIELADVTKHYPGTPTPAVDGVSLDVAEGTTLALIGPSGCGKSTLLRLLLGLIEPTAGMVRFGNVETVAGRRRMSGYVIQDGGLFPHLTARGNVELRDKLDGVSKADRRERLDGLCTLTSFPTDALDRYPVELSGGQRQRVALMRALMSDPPVLLLDEPLGALDPMVRADLQRDLREIFRKLGKTTVLVTHDMAEATYFADEVALMRDGRVVQRGTPAQLRDEPAEPFVTDFLTAQAALHGEAA